MDQIVILLLELIAKRPMAAVAVLAVSFICLILTGSIVPIPIGVLIAFWVRWQMSCRGVLTLGLSDRPRTHGQQSL